MLPVQIDDPVSGGDGGGETPVPIPNTAVKPSSADGTARSPCGRVGRRRIFSNGPEPRRRGRARSVFVAFCALVVAARDAGADQITFPLVVDHPVLAAALMQSL